MAQPGNGLSTSRSRSSTRPATGASKAATSQQGDAVARWDYSKFDNSNDSFQWTNPFFGGNSLDRTYLPPDNTFNKFTLTGNYRDLPWHSVISARYTWAETKSNANLGLSALNGNNVYNATLPDSNTFNGDNVNQSFALAGRPVP